MFINCFKCSATDEPEPGATTGQPAAAASQVIPPLSLPLPLGWSPLHNNP